MEIAVCNVSVAAVRSEDSFESRMITQILYGERVTVLEKGKHSAYISIPPFDYEGFVDLKQITLLEDSKVEPSTRTQSSLFDYRDLGEGPVLLSLGSELPEGEITEESSNKREKLVRLAKAFEGAPHLKGGRSAFGVDCSGFVQLCYKCIGMEIPRHSREQALQGEVLSFVEEAEPGDLAFFENREGEVIHVGMVLSDQRIVHSYGKVRVDLLDTTGIFNLGLARHTHKLRFIKRLLP